MKDDPSSAVRTENRRLAAIMFTDIVGFSRQMGANEVRTLRLLEMHNQIIQQAVVEHHGQVIKSTGDGFLLEFPSVVHAVQCAQHLQTQFRAHNAGKEKVDQIHIRIGIHLGDIVVQANGDVQGDGVNIAARLQPLAEPDTICLSQKVYEEVEKKVPLGTVVSLGRPKLKNIAQRFPVYALLFEQPRGLRQTLRVQWLKLSRRVGTAHRAVAAVLLLALVSVGTLVIKNVYFPTPFPGQSQGVAPTNRGEVTSPLPLPDKPSIVVLPFVNLSEDPKQEYFSDGLTEDLTSDLSKISSLFVIARNSAFTYKGKAVKVQDVSKELGVRYVLEGSVRKVESQVRITAQLVEATTGHHLWAERYDGLLQDIFALQDEITQKILGALGVEVYEAELERVRRIPTENLNAYDCVLRGGEYYYRFTAEANVHARQLFERARELDPYYAEAHAWLGWTYWLDWTYLWSQEPQNLERAFELAQRAIALDGSLANAHMLLGYIYLYKRQHPQAIAAGERALALNPNHAVVHMALGLILNYAGRPEEGLELVEKAMRLDPHNPALYLPTLGQAYYLMGRYEEAIAAYKQTILYLPNHLYVHLGLAATYSLLGREEEARAEAVEVLRISPNFSLEVLRQTAPVKDPARIERFLAALRKAGLK